MAAAGWTPQSGSVTPTAHPLSIHFPSAQVIKKHLCFSIRLHIWGASLSRHSEEGTQVFWSSAAAVWPRVPCLCLHWGTEAGLGNHRSTEPASKWPKPPRTLRHWAPGGALMPALKPMPAFAQANSLYPHENQWMEQIVLNYVK